MLLREFLISLAAWKVCHLARDYYDILGVERRADANAIKKAYRRLAKQYHPDVNKDAGAELRFKEIQEAYDVLKDDTKRQLYDRLGHRGVNGQAGGQRPPGSGPFNYRSGTSARSGPFGGGNFRGSSRRYRYNSGAGGFGSIFDDMFGGDGSSGSADPWSSSAEPQTGKDLQHSVTVDFNQIIDGDRVTIELSGWLRGSGMDKSETIEVTIPPGLEDGAKLRIRGKGNPGKNGGPPGDLILVVHCRPHPWFKRDGLNLILDVPISISEAVLGTELVLPSLHGKVKVKIPAGTQNGHKLRLRGAGLVNDKADQGDLMIHIKVDIPTQLTEGEKEIWEALAHSLPDPRKNLPWT